MPKQDKNRIVSAKESPEEVAFEKSLRPKKLNEYIGQNKVKDNLNIFMAAAKKRQEPIEHVLLHGCPGLGKTTLAHIIANEMGTNIKVTSGPAIERTGDLAAILTNLSNGDILFIDEIHRLNKIIEEVLYPAMEDFALDIVIGKGPSARTLRLDLPKFTLIGATTRVSLISAPLRDRFGATFRLDFYNDEDIEKIIERNAQILKTDIESMASELIAKRARKTPRVANRLLKRVRDYAQVKGDGIINSAIAQQALNLMDIDQLGLDEVDRKILQVIIEKFSGGPVGLNTLAAAINEEMETLEDIYEPFLMQLGFLNRTPRGRTATKIAYEHLGLKPRIENQNNLL
ncbi:MAG: Holliday junction DNA helicase RuvB [Candidatus Buchananbacteria bacterium RBG_13_36_9]|uniref:Holliday junction branch migration complex subunit RuvB n=1 Tax=Candidatus Buchananbacteria bacterium RBG_13_36_9 TaxID=1797530 RepID=A0A1G1XN36_9BACT|nr:MAG: Holliday junction DNA helicase RuvB [Candidatus Buchananbacteria bacterium RBG_13_36_9]